MARTIARDHDDKRAVICKTAALVFARKGFNQASMADVALECGIAKGSLYHYFDGKQDLLFEILDRHLGMIRDRLLDPSLASSGPEARLESMILAILMAYRGADNEHRLQMNALGQISPGQQKKLRDIQVEMVNAVREIVALVATREIGRDRRKLHAATMSLFGMLNWFYMWNRDDSIAGRKEYARMVSGLFIGGLKSPHAS